MWVAAMLVDAVIKEKRFAGLVPIPSGVGPVDIFVYDSAHNRCILIEAKDLVPRIIAKDMKEQRDQFLESSGRGQDSFLFKLKKQVAWFRGHIVDLQEELGIPPDGGLSVEGVIVVGHTMMWPYFYFEPLPVLDEATFLERLRTGRSFLSDAAR